MYKNKQKTNSLEKFLWKDEEILWQGNSEKSLSKHLETRFTLSPLTISAHPSHWVQFIVWVVLGNLLLAGLYFGVGVDSLPIWLGLPMTIIISIFSVLIMIAALFIPDIKTYLRRRIWGISPDDIVVYGLTNNRILLGGGVKSYDVLYHELNGVEIQQDKEGYLLIWRYKSLGARHDYMPPFMNLNDYDVQQIIDVLKQRATENLGIIDKRFAK